MSYTSRSIVSLTNPIFHARFTYLSPFVYLGASNYSYILNNINNAPMALMIPCRTTSNGSSIVHISYATLKDAAACSPNVTISYIETFAAFGGGSYERTIYLNGLDSPGVQVPNF